MSSAQRKHLLMISDQDMLRAGNQVLYQTVRGYVTAGFDVTFVTNQKDDPNVASAEELFGPDARYVDICRFPITFHTWRQRLIGKGWIRRFQKLLGVLKGHAEKEELFPPALEAVVPFASGFGDTPEILSRLGTDLFERYAYRACMKIAQARPIHIVYGFETMAMPTAQRIAARLGVPLCGRFQGSFLKHALDDGTAEKLYPLYVKGTAVKADLCIMSNDGTKGEEVLLRLGHPPERILFLLDGVRKDIYRPEMDPAAVWAEYGIPAKESTRIILTLSKLSPWKRLDRVIGAMPAILREVPDAYLVITHRGTLRTQLEQYANELGVANRVIFTGPIPHTQVYRLLNACDLHVHCSDHASLSNTVMEALVCGKPVVSINDGSLDGIVTHGYNGLLANLRGIREELPAHVITLLEDDAQRSEMGRNARRFAEANLLTWEERMAIETSRVEELLRAGLTPVPQS
ncbi:MAG: glycosyltransferase family 4 protein [Dehalococcoidia bacterium]|nr:glycosyltransferase family 4 protein [Dehalococcoidia bacterium]